VTLLDDGPLLVPHGWRERRRLAAIDRDAAHRALLVATRDALAAADAMVATGWLQDGWFAYRDADGREREAGSAAGYAVPLSAITRACLVGALVVGAGGADRPETRTAVEAAWHALRSGRSRPIDWMQSPGARAQHVRELTSWNDRPGRTSAEVRELLASAATLVVADLERVRLG
jgi:hypothetical protein